MHFIFGAAGRGRGPKAGTVGSYCSYHGTLYRNYEEPTYMLVLAVQGTANPSLGIWLSHACRQLWHPELSILWKPGPMWQLTWSAGNLATVYWHMYIYMYMYVSIYIYIHIYIMCILGCLLVVSYDFNLVTVVSMLTFGTGSQLLEYILSCCGFERCCWKADHV